MHTRLYTCVTRSHRCVRCGGDNIHIECYTHSALVNCSNKYETRSIRHLFIGHEILLQLFASKNCSNAALFGKQYNTRIVHWKLPLAKCNWSTHWNKELAFQWSAPFHTIVFCAIVMPCMSSLAKHSIIDHFSKVTMNRGAIIQWHNNKLSSSIHSASHTYAALHTQICNWECLHDHNTLERETHFYFHNQRSVRRPVLSDETKEATIMRNESILMISVCRIAIKLHRQTADKKKTMKRKSSQICFWLYVKEHCRPSAARNTHTHIYTEQECKQLSGIFAQTSWTILIFVLYVRCACVVYIDNRSVCMVIGELPWKQVRINNTQIHSYIFIICASSTYISFKHLWNAKWNKNKSCLCSIEHRTLRRTQDHVQLQRDVFIFTLRSIG